MSQLISRILFSVMLLGLVSTVGYAQDEKDFGLQKNDFSFSIGAGKNKFFHDEYELVAPYMVNVSLDYAFLNKFEVGIEYSPVFFADRSNVNFVNVSAEKNTNFGGIQNLGGNLKYGVYNDYGVLAYLVGGGKYGVLNRNQYIEGDLRELDGEGYSIVAGIGVRYQLGDEYGDVFPWFFEMSLLYSRNTFNITNYTLNEEVQDRRFDSWNDLKYNGLDVVIRFGYRFRKK